MKLDVESLRTFSSLARSGTERAADSLSVMTDIPTNVEVTKLDLATTDDVTEEFEQHDYVSIQIRCEAGLEGVVLLTFERAVAADVVEHLIPESMDATADGMARTSLEELGNVMVGGFVDGWADYLGTAIEFTTPTYVETENPVPRPDADALVSEDHILVFRNQLRMDDTNEQFLLYMFPTRRSLARIRDAADTGGERFPIEKFATFEQMITDGAHQASADLTSMTGLDTGVEVSRLSFVPIDEVPLIVDDDHRIGVVMEFTGPLSGYLAILFDEQSANDVVRALMPSLGEGDAVDAATRQPAIQEIGNIMTSGFIDGWANSLETTIDMSPPQYADDYGPAILDPLASRLARQQEHAFLIDTIMHTPDADFTCEIYALPDENELQNVLTDLSPAQY
ncbi:MAG: chemotaxis protein CheC [Halorientalis sp.]